jgi:ATP-dependent Lhr-like helicase
LAERRAQAISLDPNLLAELLGSSDLRELLDPAAMAAVTREVSRLAPERHAHGIDAVHDLLRGVGDLTTAEAVARGATATDLAALEEQRRAIRVRIAGAERWLAIEDAGRVRDALGVALPVGVPEAYTEPVRDPLGDLVSRYARTHGPFVPRAVAARFGLGVAVVDGALARLASSGRLVQGQFGATREVSGAPPSGGTEWCDAEVLRMIRRRSLAALRREVEPVPTQALARFVPSWQGVGAGTGRGLDALLRAIEQLAGVPVPASALETLVLPSRVAGYAPALLDELTLAGEVIWSGAGSLPGNDGWVVLAPADLAAVVLPAADEITDPLAASLAAALGPDEALFFTALAARAGTDEPDATVAAAVRELMWAGVLTNDTLAPVRAVLAGGRAGMRRLPPKPRRLGRYATGLAAPGGSWAGRPAPHGMAGRWSAVPARDLDPTQRALAAADVLLDRYGVVTRGAVAGERLPGGFAAVYPVLKAAEESGRARRGYFVDSLGAAQFALPGAVDRLRSFARADHAGEPALVLSATDPANVYGAALPWPAVARDDGAPRGHQPSRKAGALVVLVDGACVLYVERGGRSLLSFSDDPAVLQPAADALALAVREGALGKLQVERADGAPISGSTLGVALESAGFRPTPRGLRLRA